MDEMKELNRRARKDSDGSAEVPDFIYYYSDSDTLAAEIAEWYTYSEEPEFLWNLKAFKNSMKKNYGERKWSDLNRQERKTHITRLLDQTEISNKQIRDDASRAILYLAQGVFEECQTIEDYNRNLVENVVLLYECDTFHIFVELFLFEIDNLCNTFSQETKFTSCITDNADLRVILSVLYTILEVARCYEIECNERRFQSYKGIETKINQIKNELKHDLNKPIPKINELLSSYLFQLISKFCNQNIIVFPIKKIILFLWKVLLITLGNMDDAFNMKNELRRKFNLPDISENPSHILNQMSPATPPPNPVDLVNELQFSSANSYKRKKNTFETNASSVNGLTKQTRGIDSDDFSISNASTNNSGRVTQFAISSVNSFGNSESNKQNKSDDSSDDRSKNEENDENGENEIKINSSDEQDQEAEIKENVPANINNDVSSQKSSSDANENSSNNADNTSGRSTSPPPESKSPPPLPTSEQTRILEAANDAALIKLKFYNQVKSLPWKPKVRLSELEAFLDQERKKFFGYGDLLNDLDTLVGLPYPIQESVKILKQHLYTSLSEEQVKLEDKTAKYPLSNKENSTNESNEEDSTEDNPSETLFTSLLNNLPQYLICLLKILLTSVPQTRPKTDSLQIMSDLFPEDLSGSHFFTIKLGIDTNRHKEILIKSISGIILLMLKHFKVNHVYQFEFVSQHLLFANCVPLILKFFNLNISSFIQSKSNHYNLDFPNCVIGTQPELDVEELENGDSVVFRWRNVFSCINLLRILNKLTKYKRSRVMMLVIFKSAPILKKVLRIKQAMLQYYALKLLKMQTRHLGRQWRKTNMSTMSAIYQKVRHRLNDDWAFGNEQETQGWDFQSDECALRAKIDKYIQRKYKENEEAPSNDFLPTDNSMFSCLKTEVKLPDDFETSYQTWLDDEIFSNKIDWDEYLSKQKESDCNFILS